MIQAILKRLIRTTKQQKISDNITLNMIPPIRPRQIATLSKITIEDADFDTYSNEVLGRTDITNRYIWINQTRTSREKNLAIAIQIGHILLFEPVYARKSIHDITLGMDYNQYAQKTNRMDSRAMRFAEHLLIPLQTLRLYDTETPEFVAELYDVPLRVAQIQMQRYCRTINPKNKRT